MAILPCEKVIRDLLGGPSLIATFQEMNLQFPADIKLPTNAVIPKEWSIFTLWQISDFEVGHSYSQHLEIIWPDESLFIRETLTVRAEQPDWLTVIMSMSNFPAGQTGKLLIRLWMESEVDKVGSPIETFVRVNHGVLTEVPIQSAIVNQ